MRSINNNHYQRPKRAKSLFVDTKDNTKDTTQGLQ